ncbi:MAG: NAD(P)H-dependent oxidoreductase [Terracidiphilus sp.]
MRIAILNGEPDPASEFQTYLVEVARSLTAAGHAITTLNLRDLNLKGCSGCFGCWVKTPGECVRRDDSEHVCRTAIEADLVLFASPMKMGFTSALLKRATDQMIPLLHPYFVMEGGEVHHRARYARFPLFGLLLGSEPDTDAEDIEITTAMWNRLTRNLKTRLVFTAIAERPAQEVADELIAAA